MQMLEVRDLALLPEAEALFGQFIDGWRGLGVVAGLDPRPLVGDSFPPSGHSTLLRILMRDILLAQPAKRATVVTRLGDPVRLPRALLRRVQHLEVGPTHPYEETITNAAAQRPDLLVVDRLTSESAPAALRAAATGLCVLSQLDTIMRGAGVARLLSDLGSCSERIEGLAWVLAIQRLPTICPYCRIPSTSTPEQLALLRHRFPKLDVASDAVRFYQASGCSHCGQSGRSGEVAGVDIWLLDPDAADPLAQASILPLQAYLLDLALQGFLALEDVLHFEGDLLWRTCKLLAVTEQTLAITHKKLERRVTELSAATRVLQQRTEALIALEGIGQALISSTSLEELAYRLCQNARDLCGADRAILYYQGAQDAQPDATAANELGARTAMAEILAVIGWDPTLVHQHVDASLVFGGDLIVRHGSAEPTAFDHRPPGVPRRLTDVTASALSAGLRVPLVAQDRHVGLMIVHTSQRRGFSPGAVALLQTFANQAAVAIQRAGLVDALQDKILQLEEAQAQLVQIERMERELELARQVQQSILPRSFPSKPGLTFAARNEPARQVGGDFYDVFELGEDRIGLLVGDVSGKGMPAALYMARVHSLLRAEARRMAAASPRGAPSSVYGLRCSPRATLINVHHLLRELGESGMFVTTFFGVVDILASRLVYARAGHDRPLLLREGQVQSLRGEGTVMGFPGLDDLFLSEETVELLPGDRLVFYTDGLVDAVSRSGPYFGRDRLLALLRSLGSHPAQAICSGAFEAVTEFQAGAEQYDDMTMLVLEVDSGFQEPA